MRRPRNWYTYRISPSGRSRVASSPVSSRTSRQAASSGRSPASTWPLGSAHSDFPRGRMTATWTSPSMSRTTTPPAEDSCGIAEHSSRRPSADAYASGQMTQLRFGAESIRVAEIGEEAIHAIRRHVPQQPATERAGEAIGLRVPPTLRGLEVWPVADALEEALEQLGRERAAAFPAGQHAGGELVDLRLGLELEERDPAAQPGRVRQVHEVRHALGDVHVALQRLVHHVLAGSVLQSLERLEQLGRQVERQLQRIAALEHQQLLG